MKIAKLGGGIGATGAMVEAPRSWGMGRVSSPLQEESGKGAVPL